MLRSPLIYYQASSLPCSPGAIDGAGSVSMVRLPAARRNPLTGCGFSSSAAWPVRCNSSAGTPVATPPKEPQPQPQHSRRPRPALATGAASALTAPSPAGDGAGWRRPRRVLSRPSPSGADLRARSAPVTAPSPAGETTRTGRRRPPSGEAKPPARSSLTDRRYPWRVTDLLAV